MLSEWHSNEVDILFAYSGLEPVFWLLKLSVVCVQIIVNYLKFEFSRITMVFYFPPKYR